MSDKLDEFAKLLQHSAKKHVNPQVVWAKVESVDWSKKTMEVKSIVDGLAYYDVLLGLGSFYRKPKQRTKCVIAKIENSDATILIDAEEFEEGIFTSGDSQFTIKEDGFIIKQGGDSLKDVWNDFFAEFKNLSGELKKVVVSIGVTPNVAAIVAIEQTVETQIKHSLNKILVE